MRRTYLVFCILVSFMSCDNKNYDNQNQGFVSNPIIGQLVDQMIIYDTLNVPHLERLKYIGSFLNKLLFKSTSDTFLLVEHTGEIVSKLFFSEGTAEIENDRIILTGLTSCHVVLLKHSGIYFYNIDLELDQQIRDKLSYNSSRSKLFLGIETDTTYIINPQVEFFDFKANRPDNPKSLRKYWNNYRAAMLYKSPESKNIENLVLGFSEKSIFMAGNRYFPNYNTFLTFDTVSNNIIYVHNPDQRIGSFDIKNRKLTERSFKLPHFSIEHTTDVRQGMVEDYDFNRARTMNSSFQSIEYRNRHIFLQYHDGLPEQYIDSRNFDKVIKYDKYLADIDLDAEQIEVYELPDFFGELEGSDSSNLYFKSLMENPSHEIYYRISISDFAH